MPSVMEKPCIDDDDDGEEEEDDDDDDDEEGVDDAGEVEEALLSLACVTDVT